MSAQIAPSKTKGKTFIIHRNHTFCLTVWLSFFFFWGGGYDDATKIYKNHVSFNLHHMGETAFCSWGRFCSLHWDFWAKSWWKSSLENREKPPLVKNTSPTWRWYKMCFLDVSRIDFVVKILWVIWFGAVNTCESFFGGLIGAVVWQGHDPKIWHQI